MIVILKVMVITTMVVTALVLIMGIISMSRGGEVNKKYGNRLMRMRVLFQGITLSLFAILLVLIGKG